MKLQWCLLLLVSIQLSSAQLCGDDSNEKIQQEIDRAVQWAVRNITDTVEQLLAPVLSNLGKTPDHPATSCEELKNKDPRIRSGYYWIQAGVSPPEQIYCFMDPVGISNRRPAVSCKEVRDRHPGIPSGYYWVKNSQQHIIRVYCDMERTCGGVTGGWMRVADIDMRKGHHRCPSGLNTLHVSSKRLCAMNINGPGCSSATLSTRHVQFSHVCGKIIGYQQNTPDGFGPYQGNPQLAIDNGYVDGISLTHGRGPRKHIWTFVVALHEVITVYQNFICPCTNRDNPTTINIPPYVGEDYFCETASSNRFQHNTFYPNDPLWDGEGCGPLSTCCTFNNPPWFSKQLPSPTTDDIEMRLCADHPRGDEDITFEQLELYVQ